MITRRQFSLTSGAALLAGFNTVRAQTGNKIILGQSAAFTEGLRRAGGKGATREGLIHGLESIGSQSFGGFAVNLSSTDHVASSFVELSMLTGDGRIRT